MRLIIDIPEEVYKASQIIEVKHEDTIQIPLEVIANSIPLDKIRAEIEQTAKDYDKFDDYRRVRGLWIALEIIDKYRGENNNE